MHTLSRLRLTLGKFSIKVRLKIAQKNKSYLYFAIQPVEKKQKNIVNNSRLLLFCSSLEFSLRAFLLFKACICLHVCFSCIFFLSCFVTDLLRTNLQVSQVKNYYIKNYLFKNKTVVNNTGANPERLESEREEGGMGQLLAPIYTICIY